MYLMKMECLSVLSITWKWKFLCCNWCAILPLPVELKLSYKIVIGFQMLGSRRSGLVLCWTLGCHHTQARRWCHVTDKTKPDKRTPVSGLATNTALQPFCIACWAWRKSQVLASLCPDLNAKTFWDGCPLNAFFEHDVAFETSVSTLAAAFARKCKYRNWSKSVVLS